MTFIFKSQQLVFDGRRIKSLLDHTNIFRGDIGVLKPLYDEQVALDVVDEIDRRTLILALGHLSGAATHHLFAVGA